MGRILHLGLGNFARAFIADYTQSFGDWQITGVSFRSSAVRDGLRAQGYSYSLWIDGHEARRIDCVRDMFVVPEDPAAAIAAVLDANTHIITLTVTEKAYGLGTDGLLDTSLPDISADIAGGPLTPLGLLARGLAARQAPVTVLACDNLPDNGRKLAGAVAQIAAALGCRITADVRFPSTMVDRITPATTDAVRKAVQDPMAVPTEGLSEWVIEDDFAGPRPAWPGAAFVAEVAPHEMRKLRMLNGAHSFLAYAGLSKGYTYVHDAVSDPDLRKSCEALMAEAAATLPAEVQALAPDYASALLARFGNPALNHALRQIAMDGSQKLPIRILDTRRARQGAPSPALDRAVAAWCRFVRNEVAAGRALDDPRSGDLVAACHSSDADAALRDIIGA